MYVSSLVSLAYVVVCVCVCASVAGERFARQKSRRQARNLNKTNDLLQKNTQQFLAHPT